MTKPIERREFIRNSVIMAGALAAGGPLRALAGTAAQAGSPDIASVRAESPQKMVSEALRLLGGINRFVGRGDKVVILPNPQGNRPGVSTNAEVIREVIRQCLNAGAAEVSVSSIHSQGRWYSSGIQDAIETSGAKIQFPRGGADWAEVDLPKSKILKKARIVRKAIECDALINVPVFKQHDAAEVTGCLKNLMGFYSNCNYFHSGGDAFLHQAIADLASAFSPKLLIVDAIQILADNGPFGPGRILSPKRVLAGTDMVAMDAFCCGLLRKNPGDVGHIVESGEAGLGVSDVTKLNVLETG